MSSNYTKPGVSTTDKTKWDSTTTTVDTNSAAWAAGGDLSEIAAASGDWNSTYTTVGSNSAVWAAHGDLTDIIAASGGWNSTETTVNVNSAIWNENQLDISEVASASGDWDSTYTTVGSNSAIWGENFSDISNIASASGGWNSTETTVNTTSGDWDEAYTLSQVSSATSRVTDGLSIDRQSIYIVASASQVFLEVNNRDNPTFDIRYNFDNSLFTLDTTTGSGLSGRARTELAVGTDSNPQFNYVFAKRSSTTTAVLCSDTTFPTDEFAWVAKANVQTASATELSGVFTLQRTTEAVESGGGVAGQGRGAISYERERIRELGASYYSGVDYTITENAPGDIDMDTSSGVVYQMHRQTWSATTSATPMYVMNELGNEFNPIYNFGEITVIDDGTSIANGRYFSVLIFGFVPSGEDGVARILISLPGGTYASSDGAVADSQNYDINTVPANLKGGAFLIARLVMQRSLPGPNNVKVTDQDRRGGLINAIGGGGGSGTQATTFSDAAFRVYDNTDATKQVAIEASTITTLNTRTYSAPDKNGTLALTNDLSATEWNSSYTTVQSNSAIWNENQLDISEVASASGGWNSTETTVNVNSATWGGVVSVATATTTTTAASTVTDFDINVAKDSLEIITARWYVNNNDIVPFSDTGTLSLYSSSTRHGEDAIFRADMDLVVNALSDPAVAGTTGLTAIDGSPFEASDLVWLSGANGTEFTRIESINGNDIVVEDSLSNSYGVSAVISLTPEFGGFTMFDAEASTTVWARGVLAGSQNVDTTVWLEYK